MVSVKHIIHHTYIHTYMLSNIMADILTYIFKYIHNTVDVIYVYIHMIELYCTCIKELRRLGVLSLIFTIDATLSRIADKSPAPRSSDVQ